MSIALSVAEKARVDPRVAAISAFEEQLPEFLRLAFRVAFGVLHNREAAEDVAQETVLRAFKNLGRLRDRSRIRAWIVRVAWRMAIDQQRTNNRRQSRESAAADTVSLVAGAAVVASPELERSLLAAIDGLSEKLRVVLLLAGIEGYDTREVSLLTGLPEGTVKSRLHAARKKLAESLL